MQIIKAILIICIVSFSSLAHASQEVRVGDLGFEVSSLRLSEERSNALPFASFATITMTISNHGKSPITLNYDKENTSFVNEHGYSWKLASVPVGLPMMSSSSFDGLSPSLDSVIEPGSERRFTLKLFYTNGNPGQTSGTTYIFKAEFSSWKDLGQGRVRKTNTYHVSFNGLHKSTAQSEAKSDSSPEVRVGDLSFKVTSLQLWKDRPSVVSGPGGWETVVMIITNHGEAPITLDYVSGKDSFVSDHGKQWVDKGVRGIGVANQSKASLETVIAPEAEVKVVVPFWGRREDAEEASEFDFEAEFASCKDLGEGVVGIVRTYPVSFIALRQTSDESNTPSPLGAPEPAYKIISGGAKAQPSNQPVNINVPNLLNSLFGGKK